MTAPPRAARYDGHADWYDAWARSEGATAMGVGAGGARRAHSSGAGLVIDLGCGTGLHSDVVHRSGYVVCGVDVSADQLRLTRSWMHPPW